MCSTALPRGFRCPTEITSCSISAQDRCWATDAFSPLRFLHQTHGVHQLAAAIISHPHRDHIDDIGNLGLVAPRALLRPRLTEAEVRGDNRQPNAAPKVDAYLRWDAHYSGTFGPGESPLSSRDDGAHFESFLPTRCPAENLNNRSVVSVVSYAGGKLLLCGDNEPASWLELLAQPRFRQAIAGTDVLLVS